MASSKTLNAGNLEALGAATLAELLMEISTGDAAAKRRLRLELAGAAGVGEVAREIGKRLSTIAKARSFVEWDKVKTLVADLAAQHRAIVEQVGKEDPAEGLTLLWRFVALAGPVLGRCDDSSGRVGNVFRQAVRDLRPLAERARSDPLALADRVSEALRDNGYDQFDELIDVLAPQLGKRGLDHLKVLLTAWGAEEPPKLAGDTRQGVGWMVGGGRPYADELADRSPNYGVRLALQQVADALGDVDGYIAQHDERARKAPVVAASIGRRLLNAGRAQEALAVIDAAEVRSGGVPYEWEQVRIDALISRGRMDDAQAFRWDRFIQTLNAKHLRAYLAKLPDFEDLDFEEKAMAHAIRYPDVHQALAFFAAWPALSHASRLVIERSKELNGDLYELLTPAADALHQGFPLAATILRRALIDFTLANARSTRYGHAARHLGQCERLSSRIDNYGGFATHDAYLGNLKVAHGRKTGFWQS